MRHTNERLVGPRALTRQRRLSGQEHRQRGINDGLVYTTESWAQVKPGMKEEGHLTVRTVSYVWTAFFLLSYVFDYWLCVTTCGMRNISNRYQIAYWRLRAFHFLWVFLVRFPAIASFIVHNNLFLDNHIAI